jgi:hypothetical protein
LHLPPIVFRNIDKLKYFDDNHEMEEKQEEIKSLNRKREKEMSELMKRKEKDENEKRRNKIFEDEENYNESNIEVIEKDNEKSYEKRLIRPRYNLKVEMGYEWNKYYQKYYTYENPPPKTIQGYKFQIYLNDLEDKSMTPYYKIEKSNIENTCLLIIKSGKPYKDLMFKIINKEWDMNERSGYRNYYDKGVYYLGFNFKRYRYKR